MNEQETNAFAKEIDRRLKVIEGAVGIDLDTTSACSGDPAGCPADPCRDDRCPVKNGLPARTARAVAALDWELSLVKATVDLLIRHGKLPIGLAGVAEATAKRDFMARRLDAMRKTSAPSEDGPLRELFYASLSRTIEELEKAEADLAEKEKAWNAAADKG